MAFSEFLGGGGRLETATLPPVPPECSLLLSATRGLAASMGGGDALPPSAAAQLTLPDGRLNVGTHLPLLARRYKYLSTLGEGVSAQVVLAEDKLAPTPGRLVAIKCMRRQHALAGQREARALRFLHSAAPGGAAPGVVQLLGSFTLGAHCCLVTERLYPWLLDWVAESAALPRADALRALRKMAHQLLVAVAFMHNQGLVHADIKPDNLLLAAPPGGHGVALRLADFGGCFSLTETDTRAVGCEVQTLPYRAPEAALGLPYGAAIDLWSVGVVLAEVALKRALLPCASPRDLLLQAAALLGPPPPGMLARSPAAQQMALGRQLQAAAAAAEQQRARLQRRLPPQLLQRLAEAGAPPAPASCPLHAELAALDAGLADLVMGLLAYDPARRLTAHQALLHPWFDAACPLRAVFPQLAELCSQQRAVLQSESGAAAAADLAVLPAPQGAADAKATPQQQRAGVAAAAEAAAVEAEAAAAALPGTAQHAVQQRLPSQASAAAAVGQPPWGPVLVEAQQPRPRLPAAQLAAQQWEQQRRLAAAQPYAGAFSLEETPAKGEQLPAAGTTPLAQQPEQPAQPQARHSPAPSSGEPDATRGPLAPADEPPASAARKGGGGGGSAAGRGSRKRQPKPPAAAAALPRGAQGGQHAQAFDLLLEAAAADSTEEGRPVGAGSRQRVAASTPRRRKEAPGGSAGSGSRPAGRTQAQPKRQRQQERPPLSVASSGPAPSAVRAQPASGRRQQQRQGSGLEAAGGGDASPSAHKRKQPPSDGQAGGQAGATSTRPPASARKKQKHAAAADELEGTPPRAAPRAADGDAAAPGTSRPRREKPEDKAPWWVVRG